MDVASGLDRFFEITKRGSNISTEVKGGILVFLSMAYIISVNTGMMATSGMDESACYTATIVMSVLDQIPPSLRFGITAGIGCFIMFIGLQNAGIIVEAAPDTTIVSIGDFSSPGVILSFFCIILTIVLYARKVVGAIFIGMVVTAVIGMAFSVIPLPDSVVELPSMPEVGAFMDGISSDLLSVDFLMAVISLAFVQFFDSTGTLMATGERAGIIDKDGNVQCERALLADSATSVISGVVGATPTGSFAESTVGIEAGARTGLASLTVAVLFGLALFIGPLFSVIDFHCTVAAMVIVGAAMMTQLKGVEWDDWPVAVAVLGTVIMMILTYSITDGIVFGIMFYCVAMVGARRWREVSPVIYGLAVISALYLIFVLASL